MANQMKKLLCVIVLFTLVGCGTTSQNQNYLPKLKQGDYIKVFDVKDSRVGQVYKICSNVFTKDYWGNDCGVYISKDGTQNNGFSGVLLTSIYSCDSLGQLLWLGK